MDATATAAVSEMPTDRRPTARGGIGITEIERAGLLKWARSRTSAARVVMRSRIVLLAADGLPPSRIARRLGTTVKTASLWLRRFESGGVDALVKDASGRGRKPSIAPAVIEDVRSGRRKGLTVREIARRTGISPASVVRVLRVPR